MTIVVDLVTFLTDLNQIKGDAVLATSLDTTWIHISHRSITDMASEPNDVEHRTMRASKYVPDSTAPKLRSFDYTHDLGLLILHFDEPMDYTTVDVAGIALISAPTNKTGTLVQLTASGSSATTVRVTTGRDIELSLSAYDIQQLDDAGIGKQGRTFLRLPAGAVNDMADPENEAAGVGIGGEDALGVGPTLIDFVLDMDQGLLTMLFSEHINGSSFSPTGLTLVGSVEGDSNDLNGYSRDKLTHTLSVNSTLALDSYSTASGMHILVVQLAEQDLEEIKLIGDDGDDSGLLATSISNTFLAMNASTLRDTDDNQLVEISASDAREASRYSADETKPTLRSVAFDMDELELTFVFDEPVSARNAPVSHITLQGNATRIDGEYHTLSDAGGSAVTSVKGTRQTVSLGKADADAVKLLLGVASNVRDSWVSIDAETWLDRSSRQNPAEQVLSTAAVRAVKYAADVTRPNLISFALDLERDTIDLTFDEPVAAGTLDVTGLTLSQYRTTEGSTFTLTNSSSVCKTEACNGLTHRVYLSAADRGAINSDAHLAYDAYTTFALVTSVLVKDIAGNVLTTLVSGAALPASSYTPDSTGPMLLDFSVDLDTGLLVLSFSELVRADSFDPTGITLLETRPFDPEIIGPGAQSFTITDATANLFKLSNRSGVDLEFTLAKPDLDSVKALRRLATDRNTTALSMAGKTITDMSYNPVDDISHESAMLPSSYAPDTTPPTLDAFSLDMNAGMLVLHFSEAIEERSVDLAAGGVVLSQFSSMRAGGVVPLSGGDVSRGEGALSTDVSIALTIVDLNALKLARIGTETNRTWLTVEAGAFRDMAGLPLLRIIESGIVGGGALRASSVTLDTTAPRLTRFVVDRSARSLHLTFDETVDVDALLPEAVVLTTAGQTERIVRDSTVSRAALYPATELVFALDAACELAVAVDADGSNASGGVLVRAQNFSCDWDAFNAMDGARGAEPVRLTIRAGGVRDLAVPPNAIFGAGPVFETSPFCGPCESGRFLASRCTAVYDAVCQNCTACSEMYPPSSHYTFAECDGEYDTSCSVCRECPQGTFDDGLGCNDAVGGDRVCLPCTTCGMMEYEISPCTAGVNRICGSCKVCQWSSAEQEIGCRGAAIWWRMENCCRDTDGNLVDCNRVDLEDLRISARNSRQHWVFDSSTPEVEGYTQEDWTPG